MCAHPRILILEDEALIALHLQDLLEGIGCFVVGPYHRPGPALESAERDQLDGGVLDIHLDGNTTSCGVAAALHRRSVPFIFVTAVDKAGVARLFPRAAVIPKPLNGPELRGAVLRMLGKS